MRGRVALAQRSEEVGPADAGLIAHLAFGLVRSAVPSVAGGGHRDELRLAGGLAGLRPAPTTTGPMA